MERKDAELLMRTYMDFCFLFNLATERSMGLEFESAKKLRRAVAEALLSFDTNFVDEIRQDFPDLVPPDLL